MPKITPISAEHFRPPGLIPVGLKQRLLAPVGAVCDECRRFLSQHGTVVWDHGGLEVCPGDWVITEPGGNKYLYSNDQIVAALEPILDEEKAEAAFAFTLSLSDHTVALDDDDTLRFRANEVIRWLLDSACHSAGMPSGRPVQETDLNSLWVKFANGDFTVEDMMEFYRLLGYSVGGFEEVFSDQLDEMEKNAPQLEDEPPASQE